MARFLIEIPHQPEIRACAEVVKAFLSSGSHLLTHADWGCMDGNHCAWLTVDLNSKDEALMLVPVVLRPRTRVTALNKFSIEQIDSILARHPAP
jgi:hypothetical protein